MPSLAEAAWLALLIAAPAAMNPLATRVFEAFKLVALAPLAALLAAALLAGALRGRWRLSGGWRLSEGPVRLPAALLAAFLGVAALATAASSAPWSAFFGNYLRREGLCAWLIAALLFFALATRVRERVQVERAIDALLLGSVIPCLYALLQHAGLSTGSEVPGAALSRPGGSLGNPVFLGDYLLLVIPVCMARLAILDISWARRWPWLLLLLMQGWVLLLTQSRAPLLALGGTLWLLLVLPAAWRRSRSWLAAAAAALLVPALLLAALSLVPALAEAARGVPLLRRFVFAAGLDLSSVSRLGIWQAGVDLLAQAPLLRQLIGHGPDVAHYHYFAHLPPGVLAIEGQMETVDRLHNETLELAATVGVAGLLAYLAFLAALVHAATRVLAPTAGGAARRPPLVQALVPLGIGVLGAAAAVLLSGGRGAAAVGFGLGAGLGWAVLLVRSAWASAGRQGAAGAERWLTAVLAAVVIGFWIDTQVSLPVLATRIVFFALAGLLVALAAGAWARDAATAAEPGPRTAQPMLAGWGAGIALVVATVAFFPAPYAATVKTATLAAWDIQALMLLAPLGFAWAWGALEARRGAGKSMVWAFCLPLALCFLPFWVGYFTLAALGGALFAGHPEQALGAPVMWALLWLPCACLGAAWHWRRAGTAAHRAVPGAARRARGWGLGLAGALLVACPLAWGWAELRADLLVRLAGWAQARGEMAVAAAYLDRAVAVLPGEREYHASVGSRRLERTVAALGTPGADSPTLARLAGQMRQSEAEARAALARAPSDPWSVFGLANVLQFEGMRILRPLMGETEGAAKAGEARRLFAQAQRMYPAQPIILRNWAQLEFDAGDSAAAYGLLDRMEQLVPNSEEPYAERIRMAQHAGDQAVLEATLQRAAARLGAARAAALRPATAPGGR